MSLLVSKFLALMTLVVFSFQARAAVKVETVEYSKDGTTMEGYLAYDPAAKKPRSAVLIVHDWMGNSPFTKAKAEQLAKMGYVALAADIYGKGVRPKDGAEAGKLAGQYKENRALLRDRVKAAYEFLAAKSFVNKSKILAMGYCFGGTTALELARSGAELAGTASFHGGLSNPAPQDAANIKGPVLVMHGADDPYVPVAEVAAFKKEMDEAKVKYEFVAYPGAVHAFAVPAAGNDKSKGAAYDANADKQSWAEFTKFMKKTL